MVLRMKISSSLWKFRGRFLASQILIFEPRRIFSWILLPDFVLLILMGKSAQKNPSGKSLAKSSKICTDKIPDTFLQEGRAKKVLANGSLRQNSLAIANAMAWCTQGLGARQVIVRCL